MILNRKLNLLEKRGIVNENTLYPKKKSIAVEKKILEKQRRFQAISIVLYPKYLRKFLQSKNLQKKLLIFLKIQTAFFLCYSKS